MVQAAYTHTADSDIFWSFRVSNVPSAKPNVITIEWCILQQNQYFVHCVACTKYQ